MYSSTSQIVSAFAGVDLGASTFQQQQQPHDAASVASGFSAGSTTDDAGSLYDIQQRSPAALFMSPSASFGENDGSAGYEPTMSPGAFQAAMAAGILAAQGVSAAGSRHSANQLGDTPQVIDNAAGDQHEAKAPVPSTVRKGNEALNELLTPSSVASNSAVSLPASKPDVSAGLDASTAPQAAATPVSKQTGAVDSAVSPAAADECAEDPASPAAGMSTSAAASSASAGPQASKMSFAEDQADSIRALEHSLASLDPGPGQLPEIGTSVGLNDAAPSPTASDTQEMADSEPASTQLAEIADASSQAEALSTAVQPAAHDDESAPQPAASQFVRLADSHTASGSVSTAAASSKGLCSAVSKRPAEVSTINGTIRSCFIDAHQTQPIAAV